MTTLRRTRAAHQAAAAWLATCLLMVASSGRAGPGVSAQPQVPVSYICTMHPDVLEAKPGECPVCRMALQPVRIDSAWSCPIHAAVMENSPGLCRFDRRELIPVVVNHYWTCADSSGRLHADAGRCTDGQQRQERRVVRAHGDHNPRHGGQFFMAADLWHHVEGTYPSASLFRLYVYDNFMKPVMLAGVSGQIVSRDDTGREGERIALTRSSDGTAMEARLGGAALPQALTATVRLGAGTPEAQFDFTFTTLTTEPMAPATSAFGGPAARGAREEPLPLATALPARLPEPGPPAPMPPSANETADTVTVLKIRVREVRTLIDQGNLAAVYAPAMLAKELALAVADRVEAVALERRGAVTEASRQIVAAAWAIDRAGDLGDRARLLLAYQQLAAAVTDLEAGLESR